MHRISLDLKPHLKKSCKTHIHCKHNSYITAHFWILNGKRLDEEWHYVNLSAVKVQKASVASVKLFCAHVLRSITAFTFLEGFFLTHMRHAVMFHWQISTWWSLLFFCHISTKTTQSVSWQTLQTCFSLCPSTLEASSWLAWHPSICPPGRERPWGHCGSSRRPTPHRTGSLCWEPAAGPLRSSLSVCGAGPFCYPQSLWVLCLHSGSPWWIW